MCKKFSYSLCTHSSFEMIRRIILGFSVLCFCQYFLVCKICIAWICYNKVCKIEYLLKSSRRNVQNQTHPGRDTLEIPYVRYRRCQLDMAHPFTSHFSFGNFNTALVAYDAFVSYSFIFSAMTFPVFCRSEDSFAEKTVFFRFECPVINCFGFRNLAVRPVQNLFCRCQTDLQGLKII